MRQNTPDVSEKLNEIVQKNGLTMRQAQALELKLRGYKETDICEILKISRSTLYRDLSTPRMELALGQIKAVTLQSNAITTEQAYETAMELLTAVMMDDLLPIELRVRTAVSVGEITAKAKSGDREQSVLEIFMNQNKPQQAQPASDDDGSFLLNK